MEMDFLEKIDLFEVRRSENQIYFVNIEWDQIQLTNMTEKFDRDDLLKNDYFITYSIHEMNRIGSVTFYKVVSRVIDENRNLIVFVKQETKTIERR